MQCLFTYLLIDNRFRVDILQDLQKAGGLCNIRFRLVNLCQGCQLGWRKFECY